MKVELTTDLTIENHPFPNGEVVELSDMSAKLLLKKGMAIEYKEPIAFTVRETATVKDDKTIDKHIRSGGIVKRNNGKRKGTSKG
jgi:hypothetical protein